MPETIGAAIRRKRNEKGWNTFQLAQRAKVDKGTVNRAERGIKVTRQKLEVIARAVGLELAEYERAAELDKVQPWQQTAPTAARYGVPPQPSPTPQSLTEKAELSVLFLQRLDLDLLAALVRLSAEDQRFILTAYVEPLQVRRWHEAHGPDVPPPLPEPPTGPKRP